MTSNRYQVTTLSKRIHIIMVKVSGLVLRRFCQVQKFQKCIRRQLSSATAESSAQSCIQITIPHLAQTMHTVYSHPEVSLQENPYIKVFPAFLCT